MGQKINPFNLRIGGLRTWNSQWFAKGKKYRDFLLEDIKIRQLIRDNLKEAGVADIIIKRSTKQIDINIKSSRPGVVIGKGGAGIEKLKGKIEKKIQNKVKISIQEIAKPDLDAQVVALGIAEQLEKRIPYRRVIKQSIDRIMQARALGCKIMVAGRLNGAEMSRREMLTKGKVPLHTLRADIDYGYVPARTVYGLIGVKVWIYKGEVFEKKESDQKKKDK
ncbi:30S ribosomal protein S3 [Patescibacteria group bacterium]